MISVTFEMHSLSPTEETGLMTKFMVILLRYCIIAMYHEVMLCELQQLNFMRIDNNSDFLVANSSPLITKKTVESTIDRFLVTSTEHAVLFAV